MTFSEILTLPLRMIWHALFWTFDRATWQFASGPGLLGILAHFFSE